MKQKFNIHKFIPGILLSTYVLIFAFCAINPYSRDVWWAENIPIVLIVAGLVVLYFKGVRFSSLAYILLAVLPIWHTIGGYYTFERVPFEWFSDLFGFERNMYDRVGHFSVGLYAYAMIEYLIKEKLVRYKWLAYTFAIAVIMSVANAYELIEWWYASTYGGDAGAAFLGSQGDIWDAQKDMWMDTLGALFSGVLYKIKDLKR